MKSDKSLWFYNSNGDVVMVIHKIESLVTKTDLLDFIANLPLEISDQISYVDGVERVFLENEA